MKSDPQTSKRDISKCCPEDNLSFIKQVEMDLSNESVEDRRNGNRIEYDVSRIATRPKITWIQDQESCARASGVSCYDTWQIDELLYNTDIYISIWNTRPTTWHSVIYDAAR